MTGLAVSSAEKMSGRLALLRAAADEARRRHPIAEVVASYGLRAQSGRRPFLICCPFHADRTPSCSVDPVKGVFFCHGCGEAGDTIAFVAKMDGTSEAEAIRKLAPDFFATPAAPAPAARRPKVDIAAELARREEADARALAEKQADARGLWREARADAREIRRYLEARGIDMAPPATLRFHPGLPYWGFADAQAVKPALLGTFPAMLAPVVDRSGHLIGLHRTYLAPDCAAKLAPPGDSGRNKAKKILGAQRGGQIRLSPMSEATAAIVAEGIETALAFAALHRGQLGLEAGETCLLTAVSLGNLAGRWIGSRPHPAKVMANGKPARIASGVPDMDAPGFLPPPKVRDLLILGDGDGDSPSTRALVETAQRRFARLGLAVRVAWAPAGEDFNDVLRRVPCEGRAA